MALYKPRNFFSRIHIGVILALFVQYSPFLAYPMNSDALLVLVLIHVGTMLVLISPIGEAILRITGQTEPLRQDMEDYLRPILNDVIVRAQAVKPQFHGNVTLRFLKNGTLPGAVAIGQHTIAVSNAFMDMANDEQEALLAQEVAHLALHHNIILLAASPILIFVWSILKLYGLFIKLLGVILTLFSPSGCIVASCGYIMDLITKMINFFCVLLLAIETRSNTYAADRFVLSMSQDYAMSLCYLLDNNVDYNTFMPDNGFFTSIAISKPTANARIQQMIALGVPYSKY